MLFITNRFPKQSIRTRVGRSFEFDFNNNAASNSVFYCERGDTGLSEIGGYNFLSRLRESPYRQILFYYTVFQIFRTMSLRRPRSFKRSVIKNWPTKYSSFLSYGRAIMTSAS